MHLRPRCETQPVGRVGVVSGGPNCYNVGLGRRGPAGSKPIMMLTEERNPATLQIDRVDIRRRLELMNREDRTVAEAVRSAIPQLAPVIEQIGRRLRERGRLFYVGAGTSGRLGVLDAVECRPTFGVDSRLVQGILAGGYEACYRSVESVEDSPEQGAADIQERGVSRLDAVVGLAASGRTPYTIGAIQEASRIGALTVGISCNPEAPLSRAAELVIEVPVGPEVIAGSTRLKAGTAQKLVLNMISTCVMIELGHVYSNLMVNLELSNRKLIDRGIRIVAAAGEVDQEGARAALHEAGDVRSAIVMLQLDCSADEARGLVAQSARIGEILDSQG